MIIQAFHIFVVYILLKILPSIYQHIYSRCRSHFVWKNLRKKHAAIIGATGTIGEWLAMKFAERGMKMVLVDRCEQKLSKLRATISLRTECHVHAVNIRRDSDLSFLDRYDIRVLVNCMGVLDNSPEYFVERPIEESLLASFGGALLAIGRVLVGMMENKHGYILNLGPLMGGAPDPLRSISSCLGGALESVSSALYYELEAYNVNIEYICTGNVLHRSAGFCISSIFCPSTESFAESVLNTFGSGKMIVPHISHFVLHLFLSCIPPQILGRLILRRNRKTILETEERDLPRFKFE